MTPCCSRRSCYADAEPGAAFCARHGEQNALWLAENQRNRERRERAQEARRAREAALAEAGRLKLLRDLLPRLPAPKPPPGVLELLCRPKTAQVSSTTPDTRKVAIVEPGANQAGLERSS